MNEKLRSRLKNKANEVIEYAEQMLSFAHDDDINIDKYIEYAKQIQFELKNVLEVIEGEKDV